MNPKVFFAYIQCFHTGACDFNVGFGVISTTSHASGDFLLQYAGETLKGQDGEERLKTSTENKIFFYKYNGKELW